MNNGDKIILDLCGGTGSWSRPYKEAGYDVRLITWPENDVRTYTMPDNVYGILAAPPCTQFSFARTKAIKPRDLLSGMNIVISCLECVWHSQYQIKSDQQKYPALKFWALENPYFGMLRWFLGKPAFIFDPWEFGDGYQKRTALWGYFNEPKKHPVEMTPEAKAKAKTNSYLHTLGVKFDYLKSKDIHPEVYGKFDRQTRRSITPAGFAKAFMEANP